MKNNKIKPVNPKIGQESVWDYPRPPKLEKTTKEIKIIFNGELIAHSKNVFRVLETSHPPVYYIPRSDIKEEFLISASGSSYCEYKGRAKYYDLQVKDRIVRKVAWSYSSPTNEFTDIKDHIAFYAEPMDECTVNGEKVIPQPGNFYGGWITSDIVGPFKGSPGTMGW